MILDVVPYNMESIVNEVTRTVHKHETGASDLHTRCGVTYNLDPEQLQTMSLSRATTDYDASKCGRCFEDGGGY
jgi:hypothetical protein